MLKPLLLIFINVLFLFVIKADNSQIQVNSNENLLKSLTATCGGSETCTFSLVLSSIIENQDYYVQVNIFVDSDQTKSEAFQVNYGTPRIINFEVKDQSEIQIKFQFPTGRGQNAALFKVYNQPNGGGHIIQYSKSPIFLLPNNCQTPNCVYQFIGSSSMGWPLNVFAYCKINNTLSTTLNTINSDFKLLITENDILSIEIGTNPLDIPIPDGLTIDVFDENGLPVFSWKSSSFFNPMVFPAICVPSIPSPFGGDLSPITQEQINAFLASIGASYSTLWYLLTHQTQTEYELELLQPETAIP